MMELKEKAEFTNHNGDKVTITLFQDSAGGFHLITGCKMLRRTEEKRIVDGALVGIPVNTWTDETSIAQIPTRQVAIVEFNMTRAIQGDPEYSMKAFTEWQTATDNGSKEEGK
jgi:hypothetical protein